MSELVEEVRSRIIFQIEQIDRLLQTYAELLERVQQREPDLVEVTAAASVLHAFYNGLENIFMDIAREIDRRIPSGLQWHRNFYSEPFGPWLLGIAAQSILYAWLYNRAQGSLLLVSLFHAAINTVGGVLYSGSYLAVTISSCLAAVILVAVAAIRRHLW